MDAAEQSHEVAVIHPQPVSQPVAVASPLDLPAEQFRAGLDRRRENRASLMEWVRSALVEGSDYGRIHVVGKNKCPHGNHCTNPAHFSKPSLFKPGAEKICGMLGVTVYFPTLHDYEQAALHGVELKHIIIRCEIKDASGRVVADGVGARSLKQDYGDINKALKMAEKSAHIDATLRMAGLSEVFTQDLEDMIPAGSSANSSPKQADASSRQAAPVRQNAAPISTAQHKRLEARIHELGLDRERVKAWVSKAWSVEHLNEVPKSKYSNLDKRLDEWAKAMAEQEAREEREAITNEGEAQGIPEQN
ncbi:hypothetical protein [Thiolapillus sp.]